MFFFFLNNNIQVKLGASPKEADVAIVSINSGGTVGELNQMVLKEYGYDRSILKKLNLDKGFDLLQGNGKPILFVVTVGIGNPINNLHENLRQAITFYFELLSNKKIWIPLMATGSGKVSYLDSYKTTISILEYLNNFILKFNCQFIISIPNDEKGKVLFNQIDETNKTVDSIKGDENSLIEKFINNSGSVFFLVGSNWGNSGDQSDRFFKNNIWENGYGDGQYSEIINKINQDDFVILKSTYATKNGKNFLRIKGLGLVVENPVNGVSIKVNWIIKNQKIDIAGLSFYRDTITSPNSIDLEKILSNLDYTEFEKVVNAIANSMIYDPPTSALPDQDIKPNILSIAGLTCDSERGEDHLDIKKDVEAFARVMAAKSFIPPLAIALLGKWGSGKSFFMHKLKENIQKLSQNNPQDAFCEGIAQVHFNSWSYMDANLWASIVTRIFEALDDYIKNTFDTEKEIKNVENQLFNKLNVSKEQLNNLNKQKESIDNNIQKLQSKKDKLKSQLEGKIKNIKTKTLTDIINKVDEEFKVRSQIKETLKDNPTFVSTTEKFKTIVPEKYWDNPTEFYNQLKSSYSFLKAFFHRDKIWKNILWIVIIILFLILTPVITYLLNLLISWQDFTLTNGQWFTISLIGSGFVRAVDTFVKLKKQIAPFWKIKEDYEASKANALFKFEQEEKGLRLEINNFKQEIIQIDSQIKLNKEIKATLEFKLKNALSTEALYSFIEKRANSEDYKKHLGIVSLIRKDFEILSGLLTGHQSELVTSKESHEFKELFGDKKSLERIILYIDDLDRCPEERVVEVLEAVHLLMAFPLFVVVVGVDPRWMKTALKKKYENQFAKENESEEAILPANYLEKIFQVPFHLKDAGDESIKGMIKTLAQAQPDLNKLEPILQTEGETLLANDFSVSSENGENTIEIDPNLFINSVEREKKTDLESKETIKALNISEKECELLQNMSKIIGNNPRAIKRFVNVYRIVKTHEDFGFTNEEARKAELAVIMFLLALPMGNYKNLVPSLEYFLDERMTIGYENLDHFLNSEHLNEKSKNMDLLDDRRKEVYNLLHDYTDLLNQDVNTLREHYQFIKRFTFNNK